MIDSFIVGISVYYPESLIRPRLIPWNPAAEENLYKKPLVGWFADNWKCIPVKRGRKDVSAIFKIGKAKAIRFTRLDAICKELDCQPGDLLEYIYLWVRLPLMHFPAFHSCLCEVIRSSSCRHSWFARVSLL